MAAPIMRIDRNRIDPLAIKRGGNTHRFVGRIGEQPIIKSGTVTKPVATFIECYQRHNYYIWE